MKLFIISLSVFLLVNGSPLKPPPSVGTTEDKLEAFPWIKASKAKARFGTTEQPCTQATTPAPVPVAEIPVSSTKEQQQPQIQPIITTEMLQNYLAALAAQLQPFVQNIPSGPEAPVAPPAQIPSAKKPTKGKSSKLKVRDAPDATTEAYWLAEKKVNPDSLYDEFYLDWLRKRQIEEEAQVASQSPSFEQPSMEPVAQPPQQPYPYPSVPMTMNPYMMSPFMYPLVGLKVSKAMAQAQVNAALTAMNITTTPKPVKIKLKIPIPAGSDIAQVVASGIAGFPTGTTYELSKKK